MRPRHLTALAVVAAVTAVSGCGSSSGTTTTKDLHLDYAYYNPLSLVIRDQQLLEKKATTSPGCSPRAATRPTRDCGPRPWTSAPPAVPPHCWRGPTAPDQDGRRLRPGRVDRAGGRQELAHQRSGRSEGQEGRGHQGHRPVLFPVAIACHSGAFARGYRDRQPATRRRQDRARARRRRRMVRIGPFMAETIQQQAPASSTATRTSIPVVC